MKWLLILAFSALAFLGIMKGNSHKNDQSKSLSGSFAVLELFTSEGCSSCPPADRLVAELTNNDSNIISLSFHVDYWDRLGWRDPFSNAEFTDRQQDYAKQFHIESIYTPQLIINGEYEMIGSDRAKVDAGIKKAFSENSNVQITIADVKEEKHKLYATVNVKGSFENSYIICVLVQKHAEENVKAGENNGATLSHTNVVRTLIKKAAQEKMNFEITVPKELDITNQKLIVYSQQKNNLKITAAAIYNP